MSNQRTEISLHFKAVFAVVPRQCASNEPSTTESTNTSSTAGSPKAKSQSNLLQMHFAFNIVLAPSDALAFWDIGFHVALLQLGKETETISVGPGDALQWVDGCWCTDGSVVAVWGDGHFSVLYSWGSREFDAMQFNNGKKRGCVTYFLFMMMMDEMMAVTP